MTTPRDITTIRNIHTVIEAIVDAGPDSAQELEATLMNSPDIQMDPRYAFLYNNSSEAGKYYRWRLMELWAMLHHTDNNNLPEVNGLVRLFDHDGAGTLWKPPGALKFERVLDFPDITTDPYYTSSSDNSDDEGTGTQGRDDFCLGPLHQAELTWHLETLPVPSKAMVDGDIGVSSYDIACVSSFAVRNAKAGLKEIVEMLVDNVEDPFNIALERNEGRRRIAMEAALARRDEGAVDNSYQSDEGEMTNSIESPLDPQQPSEQEREQKDEAEKGTAALGSGSRGTRRASSADLSNALHVSGGESEEVKADKARRKRFQDANAHIVGLAIITDILGNIDYSPDTFKYREAFEVELRKSGTFHLLSRIPDNLGMGAMTKRDWRESVNEVLRVWADKSLIMGVEEFKAAFDRPITEEKARREKEDRIRQEQAAQAKAAVAKEKRTLPTKKRKVVNMVEYNSDGEAYEAVAMVTDSEAEQEAEDKDNPVPTRTITGLTVSVDDTEVPVEETDFDDELFDDKLDGRLLSKTDPLIKYYLNATGARPEAEVNEDTDEESYDEDDDDDDDEDSE